MESALLVIFFFATGCMTTFCVALFMTKTSGPGFIFRKLRNAPPVKSSTREGLHCQWCTATWVGAVVTGYQFWLTYPYLNWRLLPLWWFATTAGAVILNQAFTKE